MSFYNCTYAYSKHTYKQACMYTQAYTHIYLFIRYKLTNMYMCVCVKNFEHKTKLDKSTVGVLTKCQKILPNNIQ